MPWIRDGKLIASEPDPAKRCKHGEPLELPCALCLHDRKEASDQRMGLVREPISTSMFRR